jgi:DNA polymerase-3 subunit gamma/tau
MESANQRSLTGTYKIYIIDECHAITTAGWQAFLKGIEETPEYTIFMFCTTEPNKIPATILNRVQRFNIAKIDTADIKNRLIHICQQEGFTNYEDTCELISKLCDGCMRDAITKLDQCADLSTDLCLGNTRLVLGEAPFERMLKLTNCLIGGNEAYTLAAIDTLYREGKDLKQFTNEYLSFVLELTRYILFKNIALTNIPSYLENHEDQMVNVKYTTSDENALAWFNYLTDKLLEIKNVIKYDTSVKAVVEAYLLQVCRKI